MDEDEDTGMQMTLHGVDGETSWKFLVAIPADEC
jgi:hypothetical protein